MNHMELGPGTMVGVALVVAGTLPYALRTREPHVSRGVISECPQNPEFQHIHNKVLI
jgi:hypothetical protein